MKRRLRPAPESTSPEEDLREALRCHGEASGYQWRAQVNPPAAPSAEERTSARITLTLTPDNAIVLAGLIRSAADRRAGAQDRWIGTAEAARQLCVTQSTIRTWLARSLPRENPFPQPRQNLRRSRWQQTAIDEWRARQKEIDATKRGE